MTIKHKLIAAALAGVAAVPVSATVLVPGASGVPFSAFDVSTQGTQLAAKSVTGCSSPESTFCGTLGTAVYQNTLGTLDFYYQFTRNTTGGTDPVEHITAGNFDGFSVDALFSSADLDAGSIFTTDGNPGDPATARRVDGVLSVNFDAANPVRGTESTATYIFRTDATAYTNGRFGVIDSQTFSGAAFQPTAAVPEVSTWAMMVLGFGAAGTAVRRSRRTRVVFA